MACFEEGELGTPLPPEQLPALAAQGLAASAKRLQPLSQQQQLQQGGDAQPAAEPPGLRQSPRAAAGAVHGSDAECGTTALQQQQQQSAAASEAAAVKPGGPRRIAPQLVASPVGRSLATARAGTLLAAPKPGMGPQLHSSLQGGFKGSDPGAAQMLTRHGVPQSLPQPGSLQALASSMDLTAAPQPPSGTVPESLCQAGSAHQAAASSIDLTAAPQPQRRILPQPLMQSGSPQQAAAYCFGSQAPNCRGPLPKPGSAQPAVASPSSAQPLRRIAPEPLTQPGSTQRPPDSLDRAAAQQPPGCIPVRPSSAQQAAPCSSAVQAAPDSRRRIAPQPLALPGQAHGTTSYASQAAATGALLPAQNPVMPCLEKSLAQKPRHLKGLCNAAQGSACRPNPRNMHLVLPCLVQAAAARELLPA